MCPRQVVGVARRRRRRVLSTGWSSKQFNKLPFKLPLEANYIRENKDVYLVQCIPSPPGYVGFLDLVLQCWTPPCCYITTRAAEQSLALCVFVEAYVVEMIVTPGHNLLTLIVCYLLSVLCCCCCCCLFMLYWCCVLCLGYVVLLIICMCVCRVSCVMVVTPEHNICHLVAGGGLEILKPPEAPDPNTPNPKLYIYIYIHILSI